MDHRSEWRQERTARRASGYERDGLALLLQQLRDAALGELDLTASAQFLDVGCATGAVVRAAAARVHTAVGVDACTSMIEQARLLEGECREAIFLVGEATALPFREASFTSLMCTSAIRYFDRPLDAVMEMRRVLVPGGRLVLGDFVPTARGRLWRRPRAATATSPPVRLALQAGFLIMKDVRLMTSLGPYSVVVAERSAQGVRDLSARPLESAR